MKKINKRIEIVTTSGKGLSSMSKISYLMTEKALSKYYEHVDVVLIADDYELMQLAMRKPDLVFLGTKKVPKLTANKNRKEYILVADYLEQAGIPTIGSNSQAHMLEQDKVLSKAVVASAGLNTAKYFIAQEGQYTDATQLPLDFPLFIKPPRFGAGQGIGDDSVVRNFDEFKAKVSAISVNHRSDSLAEEYLIGREFTVALLRTPDGQLLGMPTELLPISNSNGDKIIGKAMKKSDVETPVTSVPAGKLKNSIIELAKHAFIALGARDYGRVDIRLGKDGQPYFLEANLIPSLIDGSGNFQKACLINEGIDYEEMLLRIVDLAFNRAVEPESHLEVSAGALVAT